MSNHSLGEDSPSIRSHLFNTWISVLGFSSEMFVGSLKEVENGANPRDIKFILAEELVDRFHEKGKGSNCKQKFLERFQKGAMPSDIKKVNIDIENKTILLTNLLKAVEMTTSTSEAMRLIKQGGVKIDSEKVSNIKLEIKKGSEAVYQVGKRKFLHIKIN